MAASIVYNIIVKVYAPPFSELRVWCFSIVARSDKKTGDGGGIHYCKLKTDCYHSTVTTCRLVSSPKGEKGLVHIKYFLGSTG